MSRKWRSRPDVRGGLGRGTAGGVVALGVLLVGQRLFGAPGPLEAVASGVTVYLPPEGFEWLIAALGPWAKGVLFAGVCGGACLLAALAGVAIERVPRLVRLPAPAALAVVWVAGLGVVGFIVLPVAQAGLFGLDVPGSRPAMVVPILAATGAFALMQVQLQADIGRPAIHQDGGPTGGVVSRRHVLTRGVRLLVAGASIVSVAEIVRRAVGAAKAGQATPVARGLDPFGPPPLVTPVEAFYVVGVTLEPPGIDPLTWRLAVSGLVDRPRSFSIDELRAFPVVGGLRTIQCVGNPIVEYGPLIGNQHWRGLPLSALLVAVGARSEALWVVWRCADGYTESIPLSVARMDTTWLIYDMGVPPRPLPAEHGFPLRVLIANRYGYKQPKYLEEIVLSRDYVPGYWVKRRWDRDGFVRTYSRIDHPQAGDRLPVGEPIHVSGIASAGDRGISAASLSTDDGRTWLPAELEPLAAGSTNLTWRRWRATIRVREPGPLILAVQAVDGLGAAQDPTPRAAIPSGATGLHRVPVTAFLAAPPA